MVKIRGEKISSEHTTILTPWPKENEHCDRRRCAGVSSIGRRSGPAGLVALLTPSPLLVEELAKSVVRKGFYFVTIAAGHVVVIDQSVDDGFFGRFDSGGE